MSDNSSPQPPSRLRRVMRRDARYLILSGVQCAVVLAALGYAFVRKPSREIDGRFLEFENRFSAFASGISNLCAAVASDSVSYTVDFSQEQPIPVEPKVVGSGYLRGSRNLWVYSDLEYPDGTIKRVYRRAGPSDLVLRDRRSVSLVP